MPSKTPKKTLKKPVKKKVAPAKKPAAKKAPPLKKKVVAKKVTAKKTVLKKAPVKTTAKTAVKKPAAQKIVAKKAVAKKPVAKKIIAKKPVIKKAVAKKAPVKKVPAKKPVLKKLPVKKVAAKKATPKAVAKKPVLKTVAKTIAKPAPKPVAKTSKRFVQDNNAAKTKEFTERLGRGVKKPLATPAKTALKPPVTIQEITPIKAPVLPVAKPKTVTDSKADMTATIIPPDYEPNDNEDFMSPVMKEYFRQRLFAWRDELLRESEETLTALSEEGNMQKPDITDRASEETDLAIEFRTRDRERKLLNKINEALMRLEDDSYGYCEETGDPIPVKRLIARPTATRTLEAEELHERRERTQRDQYE